MAADDFVTKIGIKLVGEKAYIEASKNISKQIKYMTQAYKSLQQEQMKQAKQTKIVSEQSKFIATALQKSGIATNVTAQQVQHFTKRLIDGRSATKAWREIMLQSFKVVRTSAAAFGATLFLTMLNGENAMIKMSFAFGFMANKGREAFVLIREEATKAGIATEALTQQLQLLGITGFKGSLESAVQLGVTMHQVSQVAQMSEHELAEMITTLSAFGKVGEESAAGILNMFAGIRQQFKLSDSQASALLDTVSNARLTLFALSSTMKAMDAEKQIHGLGALGGALGQLGISAQGTDNILNSMFDPEKWQENALLMTSMGVTYDKMASQQLPDAAVMFDKLQITMQGVVKQAGNNLPLLTKLASRYGMTAADAKKFANATGAVKESLIEQMRTLQGLNKENNLAQQNWEKFGNVMQKFHIIFNRIMNGIVVVATPVFDAISRGLEIIIGIIASTIKWIVNLKGGMTGLKIVGIGLAAVLASIISPFIAIPALVITIIGVIGKLSEHFDILKWSAMETLKIMMKFSGLTFFVDIVKKMKPVLEIFQLLYDKIIKIFKVAGKAFSIFGLPELTANAEKEEKKQNGWFSHIIHREKIEPKQTPVISTKAQEAQVRMERIIKLGHEPLAPSETKDQANAKYNKQQVEALQKLLELTKQQIEELKKDRRINFARSNRIQRGDE